MVILERLIPESLRGPAKAKSLEEFLAVGEQAGVSYVYAETRFDVGYTLRHKVEYSVIFHLKTVNDQEGFFQQKLPFTSKEVAAECQDRTLLAALNGLMLIQSELPTVGTWVTDGEKFITEEEYPVLKQALESKLPAINS